MKPTDTSEKALEQLIVRHLAGVSEQADPAVNTAGEGTPVHAPGGYSNDESQRSLDMAIFINGLPVLTFDLNNSLTKQTVADAITQYQTDRDPNELVFQEVVALVTIQQLLAQLAPGLIGPKLRPLQERLDQLMANKGLSSETVAKRIRLLHAGKRKLKTQHFEAVAAATMGRKRIRVKHFNRQTGETLERELSPQRLVHYRDNWYVDAWCPEALQ